MKKYEQRKARRWMVRANTVLEEMEKARQVVYKEEKKKLCLEVWKSNNSKNKRWKELCSEVDNDV